MAAQEPVLDTIVRLETPEGIDLALRPAGPVARALALLLDMVFRQVGLAIVAIPLFGLGRLGIGFYLILFFAVEWFYPVLFEVLGEGQTPGKRSVGLRVVNSDGTPIGWGPSIVRNLLLAADFAPVAYVGGMLCMTLAPRFQRLGDLAAGTLVVHTAPPPSRRGAAAAKPSRSALTPRVLVPPIDPQAQRTVLSFAERHHELSEARAAELAEILEPMLGARGPDAVREVLRVADGIEGRP